MHGETEDLVCGVFADGKRDRRITQEREGRLQVQGLGVVDRRGDLRLLQALQQYGAVGFILGEDRILRPGAQIIRRNVGRPDRRAVEQRGITVGDLLPQLHLFREDREFGQEDRGLEGVEAAVDADAGVVVLVRAFAVDPDGIQGSDEAVVIGEAHPAVAVATKGFGGEEGGATSAREQVFLPLYSAPNDWAASGESGAMPLTTSGSFETLQAISRAE